MARNTSTDALLGQIELIAEQLDNARHQLWDLIEKARQEEQDEEEKKDA